MKKLSNALIITLLFLLPTACSPKGDVPIDDEGYVANEYSNDSDLALQALLAAENAEILASTTVPIYDPPPTTPKASNISRTTSLQDTINKTLERHRGLKIIRANRETAKYEVRKAKSGYGPSLDVIGDYGYDTEAAGRYNHAPGGSISLVLSQPLWDGYATRSRVRAGEATVDSLTARVFDNVTTFALDAIIAHIDVIRRREIVSLAETNVKEHLRILASQRERVQLGAAPASDVTQTQGSLLRARATLSQNVELLKAAESQYYRLTGEYPAHNLDPVELPKTSYETPYLAFEQASVTNPKVKAYLYDIDAAKHNKDLAKANFSPQVRLELGGSFSDRDPEGYDTEYSKALDARVKMNWNLFNSFADLNSVRSANSQVVESRQTVMNFMDDLQKEIEDTFSQYVAAVEQQDFYRKAKIYNRETRAAYLEQFDIGTRGLSDILDVESEFFSSSTEEVTALGNIKVGAYRMLALTGKLADELKINEAYYADMNIEESEEQLAF